jgi:glycosyltransferase involved in cell wall biosynthesis
MIKNEAEIIEHFVRVNSTWADHIFFVDDRSSDATIEILNSLKAEGLNLSVTSRQTVTHEQNYVTTDMMRSVAQLDAFDYIAPLDADEFIFDAHSIREQVAHSKPNDLIIMKWSSLIPDAMKKPKGQAYFEGFKVLKEESREVNKLLIPNALAKLGYLTMGNHEIFFKEKVSVNRRQADFILAHAPVRSAHQLISKIIIGTSKLRLKTNKTLREGQHWMAIHKELEKMKFIISAEDLERLAFCYLSNSREYSRNHITNLNVEVLPYELKYRHPTDGLLIRQLSGFIDELVDLARKEQ